MSQRVGRLLLGFAGAISLLASCAPDERSTVSAAAGAAAPAPQLLSDASMARYKAALPKVAFPALQKIFQDPGTFWYDDQSMIPSYQDSVGDNSTAPIGARANQTAKGIIVPEGKKFFDNKGHWSFPLGHTAGTDNSENVVVANFLSLPVDAQGNRLPIAFSKIDNANGKGGLGLHKWTWIYPKGSVLGEIIFIKAPGGELLPTEIRIRTRYLAGWATNSFRPFPEASRLEAAIKTARPNYEGNAPLKNVVDVLASTSGMKAASKTSTSFKNTFAQSGALDELPAFGDDALVKELLTKTTFVSAYEKVWKQSDLGPSFAPTTTSGVSVVPANNFSGLIAVNEKSCSRCHQETGRSLDTFEPQTVLYGDVWGEDGIFSFHPYDPANYGTFNTENRTVRPLLKSMVVKYNPAAHSADIYKALK